VVDTSSDIMASPPATVLAIFFAAFLLLSGPCAAATDGQWSLTDLTMAEFDTTEDNAAQGIYEAIKDLGLLNISRLDMFVILHFSRHLKNLVTWGTSRSDFP
jgi:hypothetical protein